MRPMLRRNPKDRWHEAVNAARRRHPSSNALAVEREELVSVGRNWSARHVADLIHLAELTVKRMARQGKLPAVKVGRTWQFPPDKVRAWYAGELAARPADRQPEGPGGTSQTMQK